MKHRQCTVIPGKGHVAHSRLPKADHCYFGCGHILPLLSLQVCAMHCPAELHTVHAVSSLACCSQSSPALHAVLASPMGPPSHTALQPQDAIQWFARYADACCQLAGMQHCLGATQLVAKALLLQATNVLLQGLC